MNTNDIIIGSVNIALLIVFSIVLIPYMRGLFYIRKRRKLVQKVKELRRMVAERYEFK